MSGLKLATSYSFYPHQLGLCGPSQKATGKILFRYLAGEKIPSREIRKILKEFKGAYPYYRLIARVNKIKDPFDQKVVQAYWLGNSLLEKIPSKALKEMISKDFVKDQLLPKEIALKKAQNLPPFTKAHHNFHVLIIGSVTGRVYPQRELLEKCLITWGRVKEIKMVSKIKNEVIIESPRFIRRGKKYLLGKPKKRLIFWNEIFLPQIKRGDWVSVHWDWLVAILNQKELQQLKKYTLLALKAFNTLRS